MMDDQDTLWTSGGDRLRPGEAAGTPEPCTPFVYLYEASWNNDPKFTYPSTTKALSTFPEVASLGLREFGPQYRRHLGITVTSRAQGEAVVAHVRATMKDEDPRLFCFDVEKAVDSRAIAIDATK